LILWRISNHADLSGAGGLLHSGRWHSRGRPVVYLAESPAGALVEALVHVQVASAAELPKNYQLLEIALPDDVSSEDATPKLGRAWRDEPAITRALGDTWLAAQGSLLLRVPSAVVGRSFNRLFNAQHAQATSAKLISAARYPFDDRLLRRP
jgi:RES domain-containing protein